MDQIIKYRERDMVLIHINSKKVRKCQLLKLSSKMHTILMLGHRFISILKMPKNHITSNEQLEKNVYFVFIPGHGHDLEN